MLTPEQKHTVWSLALAAFLHDVGKFAQRSEADPEIYRTLSNLQEFAVFDDRGGISYHHAAYTWQFIESNLPWLLAGNPEGNIGQWAARHHKPSSAWDWVVAEADRLSAGMDRGHLDESALGWHSVQTARLTPLASRIRRPSGSPTAPGHEADFEVGLAALDMEAIFPQPAKLGRTRQTAVHEYGELFDAFAQSVRAVPHDDLYRFFESFVSLYERFTWCIPAATNVQPRDVSLFEHSRAAAAIAGALSYELIAAGSPSVERVRERRAKRYLLAVGDLGGIQKFIYTIVAKRAARSLRGRSLAIQLLADAIGQQILRELQLPPTALLYNGGGKLWLLLPSSARARLLELAEEIGLALIAPYAGRLSFSLGVAELSGEDFVSKRISQRLEAASVDMQRKRRRQFAASMKNRYDEIFSPYGVPGAACPVCGKLAQKLARLPEEEREACDDCRALERLGNAAITARSIIRVCGPQWSRRLDECRLRLEPLSERMATLLLEPLAAGYILCDVDSAKSAETATYADMVLSVNTPPMVVSAPVPQGIFLAGLNRPAESGKALDFDDLAEKSTGIERLGILRMDVDSLAEIFQSGLGQNEASISRLTNLSRALSYFFGGHLSLLIQQARWSASAQIIYSGGDDLFIVGAWSEIPQLAVEIRKRFRDFTCANPSWGLSGGIAIVSPRFPVAAAAALAGEEEDRAKGFKREGPGAREKDALGFLQDALTWEDFAVTSDISHVLVAAFGGDDGAGPLLPRALLYRLMEIAELYRDSRRTLERNLETPANIEDLRRAVRRGKWAWQAAYTIARSANGRTALRHVLDSIGSREWQGLKCESVLIWLLRPAAHWADLLTRKER